MNKLRSKKGFTLIELIVVMIILAILAAIIIPQFVRFQESAEVSACQANQRILDSATAMWVAVDIHKNKIAAGEPSIGTLTSDGFLLETPLCPGTSAGAYSMSSAGIWTCDGKSGARVHDRSSTT